MRELSRSFAFVTLPPLALALSLVAAAPSVATAECEKTPGVYCVPKKGAKTPPAETPPEKSPAPSTVTPSQPPAKIETPSTPLSPSQPPAAPRSTPTATTGAIPALPPSAVRPPPRVTERVLERKLGADRFEELKQRLDNCGPGAGAPNASTCWDNAAPRGGARADPVSGGGTKFFEGAAGSAGGATNGGYHPATRQEVEATTKKVGSIPGGILMEGAAAELGEIADVRYDIKYNAFIIDNRIAYFVKVSPRAIAALCAAFANDDKELIGVSLGEKEIVYGKVDAQSDVAWDLKIADHFLGDIVFAENTWTRGYKFAGGYRPQSDSTSGAVAVFFTLKDFRFRVQDEEASVTASNFDVTLIPLSATKAADGGHLADDTALAQGRVSRTFEANAMHVANNIGYYRHERLVNRLFAYGELAAFLRQLKHSGFDLEALARNVPGAVP